jgi:hypothetical protein
MVNYQQGKIYRIIDNTNGNIYVGSTCKKTLAQRLSQHNFEYKKYCNSLCYYVVSSFDILKNGDYKISLIEDFPCDNKDQLRAREQYWIDNTDCINKKSAFLTSEQREQYNKNYYQQNKERLNDMNKTYHEKNKDAIRNWLKQYREKNKDLVKEQNKKYRQKKKLKLQEQEEAKSEC